MQFVFITEQLNLLINDTVVRGEEVDAGGGQ